jgi:hypothetical protein
MTATQTDRSPVSGYSPPEETPLGSYGVLMASFLTLASAFGAWFRASGRELPSRIDGRDLLLLTAATHKASRMLTKDRVTSPLRTPFTRYEGKGGPGAVNERPRGRGLRRAIGELLTCPYCLGMWVSAAFTVGLLVLPRFTRWVASILVTFFGSEVLQLAYKKAERSAS